MAREVTLPPAIPKLERAVMEHAWARGEVTVREVLEVLNEDPSRSPRAYTTVLTLVQRLEAKGLLGRRREGRADVYRPLLDRDAYLTARADAEVGELLERYGEYAVSQFARHAAALDPERRAALRRLAEP